MNSSYNLFIFDIEDAVIPNISLLMLIAVCCTGKPYAHTTYNSSFHLEEM